VAEVAEKFPRVTVLGQYVNARTKIEVDFGCGHGSHFITPNSLLGGRGCPICNQSKGEKKTAKILKRMGVVAWPQYTFPQCRHTNVLPFDFYLPNFNICIEYQGQQHFQVVKTGFFGGEKALKERQHRDKIKREFCEKRGIILVEIPYDDVRIC